MRLLLLPAATVNSMQAQNTLSAFCTSPCLVSKPFGKVILETGLRQGLLCSMCLTLNNKDLTEHFFAETSGTYSALFGRTPYEDAMQASPYIRQEAHISSFTRYLYERRPTGFGWFSWGAASWEDMLAHWRSLLTIILPEGEQAHMRFYSPGVMANFLCGCTEHEIGLLLGPMSGMAVPLLDGNWLYAVHPAFIHGSEKDVVAQYEYRAAPWWKITQEQYRALDKNLRRVLAFIIRNDVWENHPEWMESFDSFPQLDLFISRRLREAKEWEFVTDEERTRFVKLCLAASITTMRGNPACESILLSTTTSNEQKLDKLAKVLGV